MRLRVLFDFRRGKGRGREVGVDGEGVSADVVVGDVVFPISKTKQNKTTKSRCDTCFFFFHPKSVCVCVCVCDLQLF